MSFVISTDSSANLPYDVICKWDLSLVLLSYCVDGQEKTCLDLSSFDGHTYYASIKNKKVRTSMVNTLQFEETWRRHLEMGKDILYLGMSSGISGTYQTAALAARTLSEEFPERRIETFDTLAASLGEGLQVIFAAQCRDKGMDIDATVSELLKYRCRMHEVFMVDDLFHLYYGGRLTKGAAVFGTVLNIKPILTDDAEGKIVQHSKVRGRGKGVKALYEDYAKHVDKACSWAVGIAHADCPEEAERLADAIRSIDPGREVLSVCYEPVTGSHVGPSALALFYIGDATEKPVGVSKQQL